MEKIVKNMNTLKAMEKAGHIKLHNQTGSKITSLYSPTRFTCYYINEGQWSFMYKGKKYQTKYFDGCFCPYVVQS